MDSKNTKLIVIIVSVLIALSLVAVVLFNLSKKNEITLPESISLSNVQFIFASDNFEEMNEAIHISNISRCLSKNIKDYSSIKKVIYYIRKDSTDFKKVANNNTFIATYSSGDWVILIKTKNTLKLPDNYSSYHKNSYFCIESKDTRHKHNSELNNTIIAAKEKNNLNEVLLSHDIHSQFFIIEKIKSENDVIWACHDFFFNDDIQIVTYYQTNSNFSKEFKDNKSLVIKAFNSNNPKYKFVTNDNKATSWLVTQFLASNNDSSDFQDIQQNDSISLNNQVDTTLNDNVIEGSFSPNLDNHISTINDNTATETSSTNPDVIYSAQKNIIAGPYIVKSHRDEGGFFIQTADNYLSYIDLRGTLKWKVNLDSRIVGTIDEIDWYGNNKIQYIFNTRTRLYVIDVLGNYVKNFPLTLPVNSQNKIAIIKNNSDDFNIYYNGTDKAFYFLKYKNNDLTIQQKNSNIGSVSQPYKVLYDRRTPYIVVQRDNRSVQIYKSNGSLYSIVNSNFINNPNSDFYYNNENSKGLFITSSQSGEIAYIAKDGTVSKNKIKEYSAPVDFYYESVSGNKNKCYFFISKNSIEGYTPQKKNLFSSKLDFAYTSTDMSKYSNQLVFTVFSSTQHKAEIFRYYGNGKLMKSTYNTSVMPAVSDKDVYLVEGNSIIKK